MHNLTTSDRFALEGQASYTYASDMGLDVKIWTSIVTQDLTNTAKDYTAKAYDIGATATVAYVGFTGYYFSGDGIGIAGPTTYDDNGFDTTSLKTRESDGWYVQATYVLPRGGTKLGLAYGKSNLDLASGEVASDLLKKNKRFTLGVYHPLTQSLNFGAEYSVVNSTAHDDTTSKGVSSSLGISFAF